MSERKLCEYCGEEKLFNEFYPRRNRKNGNGLSAYCKPCTNAEVSIRKNIFKQKCIDLKGGKCQICGYNKCIDALEFHHLDPLNKNFLFSTIKSPFITEEIKKELDNCELLCCNCHREKHSLEHEPKRYKRKNENINHDK